MTKMLGNLKFTFDKKIIVLVLQQKYILSLFYFNPSLHKNKGEL